MIILWFLYFLNITLCIAIAYKFTTSGVIISFIAGFILSVATTIYLKIIKLKTLFTSTVTDIFSPALNDRYLEKRVFTIDVGNIKSEDVKDYVEKLKQELKSNPLKISPDGLNQNTPFIESEHIDTFDHLKGLNVEILPEKDIRDLFPKFSENTTVGESVDHLEEILKKCQDDPEFMNDVFNEIKNKK